MKVLIKSTMLSMALGLTFGSAQAATIQCPLGAATCDGTSGSDTITGTAERDVIHGLAGNDTIRGLAANDSCGGGGGNDTIECGAGRDYMQGGRNDDTLDGSLDGVRDTYKGGNGGNDTVLYNTSQSGPDRWLDFNEGGATPGDVLKITNLTTTQLQGIYGNTIEAGDPGVTNSNGDLLVNFAQAGIGSYTFTFTGLGSQSLAVGTDVVGSP